MKLTTEQQLVVEENHNLIYWYAHMRNLPVEEWYDLLAIELCYAVMQHNPDKGSLGNLFKVRADGMICKELRKRYTKKRSHTDLELLDNHESIGETDISFEQIELKEWIDKCDSEIIKLRLEGYSQTEIGKILGVSQSYVSGELKKLRADYEANR